MTHRFRIADNRTHEEAEWDDELLAIELGELKDADFDLDLTGFDPDELEKLLEAEGTEGLASFVASVGAGLATFTFGFALLADLIGLALAVAFFLGIVVSLVSG